MINEIKILDLDLKLNIVRLKLGLLKLLADHIIIVQKKTPLKHQDQNGQSIYCAPKASIYE